VVGDEGDGVGRLGCGVDNGVGNLLASWLVGGFAKSGGLGFAASHPAVLTAYHCRAVITGPQLRGHRIRAQVRSRRSHDAGGTLALLTGGRVPTV
jgi:hypothetical protein